MSANTAFDKGFQDLGYDPLPTIEYRCFTEVAELPRLVAETIASKPPLVVVWGTAKGVQMLHESAPDLPIVFVNFGDPVAAGLVRSLSRPGGKITGISNATDELLAKRVEILREALPRATHVAILFNLSDSLQQSRFRTTQLAARKVNLDARGYSALSATDLANTFAAMKTDGMDAVVLLPDTFLYVNRQQVANLAQRFRIPLMSYTTAYVDVGSLFVYGQATGRARSHVTVRCQSGYRERRLSARVNRRGRCGSRPLAVTHDLRSRGSTSQFGRL